MPQYSSGIIDELTYQDEKLGTLLSQWKLYVGFGPPNQDYTSSSFIESHIG